jgi:hypothetical protein
MNNNAMPALVGFDRSSSIESLVWSVTFEAPRKLKPNQPEQRFSRFSGSNRWSQNLPEDCPLRSEVSGGCPFDRGQAKLAVMSKQQP